MLGWAGSEGCILGWGGGGGEPGLNQASLRRLLCVTSPSRRAYPPSEPRGRVSQAGAERGFLE